MTDDRSDGHAATPREERGLPDPAVLDALAAQLVWRIGRTADDAPLTVRVGFVSSTPAFAELPRLRSASDLEVQEALEAGDFRVEWVGGRTR